MKRVSIIFLGLFFFPMLMWAQNAADILVFSVDGDVTINRNKIMIPCKRADKILTADIIDIKKGTVSLVDRNLKRVSLEKKGKYSYQQIVKQFEFANASLSNRFLVLVLDKMIHKTGPVSKAGGVVRGRPTAILPIDSSIILSDDIHFAFPGAAKQKITFFILDEEHHILFSKKITDSVFVLKKETCRWWKPGAYFWEAAAPGKDGTSENMFFIPADDKKAELLAEYDKLKKSFAGFSSKTRKELMNEALMEYRWVVY